MSFIKRNGLGILTTLVGTSALGLAGCSDAGFEAELLDASMQEMIVSDDSQSKLPFACSGVVTKEVPLAFESSQRVVTPYTCWKGPRDQQLHVVDELGAETDLETLRKEDVRAFRERYHRFDPDLRDEVARAKSDELVTADVWFSVPKEAELPEKELMVALAPREQEALSRDFRKALKRRADDMQRAIEAIGGDTRMVRKLGGARQIVPVLTLQASAENLERIGDLDGVVAVGLSQVKERPADASWYWVDETPTMVEGARSYNGTGITVADVYGANGIADTSLSGFASGSCTPPSGPSYNCYCPAAAATGSGGNHMAQAMGFVKNTDTVLPSGTAGGATIIIANDADGDVCSGGFDGAIDWALDNGADVLNRSATHGTSAARYLDYISRYAPYPFVAVAAGNSSGSAVGSSIANGLVVGAADDNGDMDRDDLKAMASFSSWINTSNGAAGNELPHIVAPGDHVKTVDGAGGTADVSGTSFSTPQVSGVAASVMEVSSDLNIWPEGLFAVLLAGPEQDVVGGWPLSLSDSVDDKDGVGAVNAWGSAQIAMKKVDGGNSAWPRGHDYGGINASYTPAGSTYSEAWNASVPAGRTLRVAAVLFAKGDCSGDETTCGGRDFAHFRLRGLQGSTVRGQSANFNGNYQYFGWKNTGTSQVTIKIEIKIEDWDGLSGTTYGMAWSTDN